MKFRQVDVSFDDDEWIFEIKHDGFRALAYLENGECRLVSRPNNRYTRFKKLASRMPAEIGVRTAILDDIRNLSKPDAFEMSAEHLTPMGFAVTRGRRDSVEALLEAGDHPDRPLRRLGFFLWEVQALEQDLDDWTPLHAASVHGYMENASETIRLLVDRGADVHRNSCLGEAPIHLAANRRVRF